MLTSRGILLICLHKGRSCTYLDVKMILNFKKFHSTIPVFHSTVNTLPLESDHKPLEWLESHKQSHTRSQRLEHWSLELRAFEFNVAYHPCRDNQCADSLSRLPISVVAWKGPLSLQQIIDAQEQDPTLSAVRAQLLVDSNSVPASPNWRKFPMSLQAIMATADDNRFNPVQSDEISHYGREEKAGCHSTTIATTVFKRST